MARRGTRRFSKQPHACHWAKTAWPCLSAAIYRERPGMRGPGQAPSTMALLAHCQASRSVMGSRTMPQAAQIARRRAGSAELLSAPSSHAELDVQDVAILHHVVLWLLPHKVLGLGLAFAACTQQVVAVQRFGPDEAAC